MSFFSKSYRFGRLAGILFLALLAAVSARSQERADCRAFHSAILHSSVQYCVYLPASYSAADAKTRKYPVLYLLHGLGGNEQSMALDGEWTTLQDLRRGHMVGEFLVVAPDGWDTFYINSRDGKTPYSDFFSANSYRSSNRPIGFRLNAQRAGSPVFRWVAMGRCESHLRIRSCSVRSARIAGH